MVVIRYHLDDAARMPEEEKERLHKAFAEASLLPIMVETLAFVSADRTHDNAFVRHVNDVYVLPHMQSIGSFHTHYARSDGCKAQFKCATHFDWISSRKVEVGVRTDWSFFCSCHGKCDCDPEGGSIKTAAANYENHGAVDGMRVQAKLPDAASFVKWANDGSPANSPHGYHAGLAQPAKALEEKLRLGKANAIYRRKFFIVAAAGPGKVDRSIVKEVKLDGSARLHSFVDIGIPGTIMTREKSCHYCQSCLVGEASFKCCDQTLGLSCNDRLVYPSKPESSLTRALRSEGCKSVNEMLTEIVSGEMVCVDVPHSSHEPWMLGKLKGSALQANSDDVNEASKLGFSIEIGSSVLRMVKFEPFEIGSRRYIETKVPLVVPAANLRYHHLEPNNDGKLRASARLKANPGRYGDMTFELRERDLRAITVIMRNEGIGAYRVESILEHRTIIQRGKHVDQFKVKWAGWDRGEEDMTWEPLTHFHSSSHLARCEELMQATQEASATQQKDRTGEPPTQARTRLLPHQLQKGMKQHQPQSKEIPAASFSSTHHPPATSSCPLSREWKSSHPCVQQWL